jgi:hypothetical protein
MIKVGLILGGRKQGESLMKIGMLTPRPDSLVRRFAATAALAALLLSVVLVPDANAKKPALPPPATTCTFSTATGLTSCVTVAPEVVDHEETPTLPNSPCVDAAGDPGSQTQTRRDVVYRTDTTTQTYKGRQVKAQNLVSTTTTSTYRTVTGTVALGACTDVTAPETSITGAPSGSTSTTATFTFVSDESSSSFACSLDAATFGACTSPATYSGLAVGAHSFSVKATDAAGNVDASPAGWSWQVAAPTPPPVITITDGPAETTNSPTADFSFTATQTGSVQCQIDSAAFASCTSPRQYYGLEAGSHTFTVKVTNVNGTGTATRSWTIEANLPTCAAQATSFTQLANGDFEVLGTDLDCLTGITHVRAPDSSHTCEQGGGTGYSNPGSGNTSYYVRSWTATQIVFGDPVAVGLYSNCVGLSGQFDGLLYDDYKAFDYPDFVAGPNPFNVTATGTSADGLHFSGTVNATPDAVPSPFAGATIIADLSHDPVTGTSGCVAASGSWSYESSEGTLIHLAPMTSSSYGLYCPNDHGGYYTGLAKVVWTPGDLLSSSSFNISYVFAYDSTTGTFTSQDVGELRYTAN